MYNPTLRTANFSGTLQVRFPTMLVLSIAGNLKYEYWVATSGIVSIPSLIKIHAAVLEMNHIDRRTDRPSPHYVHSFDVHRAKNTQQPMCVHLQRKLW